MLMQLILYECKKVQVVLQSCITETKSAVRDRQIMGYKCLFNQMIVGRPLDPGT